MCSSSYITWLEEDTEVEPGEDGQDSDENAVIYDYHRDVDSDKLTMALAQEIWQVGNLLVQIIINCTILPSLGVMALKLKLHANNYFCKYC